ncbi:MAG TPA: hypothetical protein VG368_03755, partial [Acidimicrobiales bacterium]|nr:hypothetical protein [Acidimicrobiales bacterium]
MTVETTGDVARHSRRRLLLRGGVLAVIFCVGVLPVALDLSRPHGLFGLTEYDDGVYFGASLRLIEGVFPYRDFVFVQPPGITVVLAPFAALSHLIGGRS